MINSRNLGNSSQLNSIFVVLLFYKSDSKHASVDIAGLNLPIDECTRADSLFYKNHGSRILVNLTESLELTNVMQENIEVRVYRNKKSLLNDDR